MLELNQTIDHFKILQKIGEGGMGEVYLAEDQKLSRKVALKILPADLQEDENRRERFIREAKTAASITHPNVMAIYDFGTTKPEGSDFEINYIVMEYVEGEPLKKYLENRTVSMTDLLRISEKIARGLAAAHKLNIVHRDIKTDNIMIDANGEPKILDFGLAKPFDSVFSDGTGDQTVTSSQDLTQDGKILGTVTYMSPEQARGDAVDARSDIFSFGILMYKLFAGVYPFDGGDRVSTIAKILESKHEPLRKRNETLPAELERIIDKCLQKNPDDRYQDSRDLVVDLRSLRRQFESGVTDTRSIEMEAYSPKLSKTFVLSGKKVALVVFGIIVIAVLGIKFLGSPDAGKSGSLQAKENALAILSFENKTGDPELDWLTAGLPEIMLTDLAQSGGGNVISRNRVLDYIGDGADDKSGMPSHKEAIDAAKALGASTVLSGSYFKMGDKIRIDARLEDIETGKILFGEKVIGEDPFMLVDSLTSKIAMSLNSQEMMANNTRVSDITSSSPEAYKYYIMGMENFSKGLYDKSNPDFEKAIEIDSTFALPYMRIGMGYALQSRGQQAVPYFNRAQKFKDKLPIKDKNLLDIYIDIWINAEYDAAIEKAKLFVDNYPDDKEARTFYAILLGELTRDTDAALAQMDTVMMIDPKFRVALGWYVEVYSRLDSTDKAIEYALKLKEYYSDTPDAYTYLAALYRQQGRIGDMIKISEEALKKFPDDRQIPSSLFAAYILKRDFENARKSNEIIKELHSDDPYQMITYYDNLIRLDYWKGRFKAARQNIRESIKYALETGDSLRIMQQYYDLSENFKWSNMKDSAVYFADVANSWSPERLILNYPLVIIDIGLEYEDKARPVLDAGLSNLKAKVPTEMWGMLDLMKESFEAMVRSDTAKGIEIITKLRNDYDQIGAGNTEGLGSMLVLTGRYEDGIAILSRNTTGNEQSINSYYYLKSLYYIGMANEALGYIPEAKEDYEEVLNYWNNADVDLDFVDDARQRLARLSS